MWHYSSSFQGRSQSSPPFFLAQRSVKYTYQQLLTDGNVEDGQFTLSAPLNERGEQIVEAKTSAFSENFYKELSLKSDHLIRIYQVRSDINRLLLREGQLPAHSDELLLNYQYARNNHLKLKDILYLEGKKFIISGIVNTADYSTMLKSRNDLMMSNKNFGIGFVTESAFDAINESTIYCYAYQTTHVPENKAVSFLTELSKKLMKEGNFVVDAVPKVFNANISFLIDDMGGDVPMIIILFVIVLLIMAFIFVVLAKHTVEEQAPIIGTLLASGYRKKELIFHYLMLPFCVTIFAALIGNLNAYTWMKERYLALYHDSFDLPPISLCIDWYAFLFTTILPLILILLINIIALMLKFRLTPLRFLRKDFDKKPKSATKLPNRPFLSRFRMRIFLCNKGIYAVLLFGLLFGNLLMIFSSGASYLLEKYANNLEIERPAKYETYLKVPVSYEHGTPFTISTGKVPQYYIDQMLEVRLYGVDEGNSVPNI